MPLELADILEDTTKESAEISDREDDSEIESDEEDSDDESASDDD